MEDAVSTRAGTPMHLWIVGIVSLLWNCFGAYDYFMTRMRNTEYLSQMPGVDPNAMLAYIDSFPMWAQAGWGFGVWGSFLGSILLLLRSRYAVWSFGLSLLGAVLSFGYQFLGSTPMPAGMDEGFMLVMPFVIIAVVIALFLYARAMQAKGVLR